MGKAQWLGLAGIAGMGLSMAAIAGCDWIMGIQELRDVRPLTCGWDLQIGKENQQATSSLAYGADGQLFVAGTFLQSFEFGDAGASAPNGGKEDIFVGAIDTAGKPLWHQAIRGSSGAMSPHTAVTGNGMTIVGGEVFGGMDCGAGSQVGDGSKDVFLCAFEKDGTPSKDLQHLSIAVDDQTLGGVVVDKANHIIFAGGFRTAMKCLPAETIDPAGQGMDAYVCALDLGGTFYLKKSFGGLGDEEVRAIAVDQQGDVYVAGEFNADFSMGVYELTYHKPSSGAPNIFVAKLLGSSGEPVWAKAFGEGLAAEHHVSGIAVAADGATYVVGNTTGTIGDASAHGSADGFLLKLNVTGTIEWPLLFGAEGNDKVTSVAVNTNGDVLVAGQFASAIQLPNGVIMSPTSEADTFIAAFSPQSVPLWHKQYPMATDEPPILITKDPNTMALGGGFAAPINFGCGLRTPVESDGFVVNIVP